MMEDDKENHIRVSEKKARIEVGGDTELADRVPVDSNMENLLRKWKRRQWGERCAAALENLLQYILTGLSSSSSSSPQGSPSLQVDPTDREVLQKCFAPGHCMEYQGPISDSQTLQALQDMLSQLRHDPHRRSFVVDYLEQPSSTTSTASPSTTNMMITTEDSIWMSLPKWQQQLHQQQLHSAMSSSSSLFTQYHIPDSSQAPPRKISLSWKITTFRSWERSTWRTCFPSDQGWTVQPSPGPRGTALVQWGPRVMALFSDQPGRVAYPPIPAHPVDDELLSDPPETAKVIPASYRMASLRRPPPTSSLPQPPRRLSCTIRVFRCAPRPCLQTAIARVLQESPPSDQVFDLWIRHVELRSANLSELRVSPTTATTRSHLARVGRFQHTPQAPVPLLNLLTDLQDLPPPPGGAAVLPPAASSSHLPPPTTTLPTLPPRITNNATKNSTTQTEEKFVLPSDARPPLSPLTIENNNSLRGSTPSGHVRVDVAILQKPQPNPILVTPQLSPPSSTPHPTMTSITTRSSSSTQDWTAMHQVRVVSPSTVASSASSHGERLAEGEPWTSPPPMTTVYTMATKADHDSPTSSSSAWMSLSLSLQRGTSHSPSPHDPTDPSALDLHQDPPTYHDDDDDAHVHIETASSPPGDTPRSSLTSPSFPADDDPHLAKITRAHQEEALHVVAALAGLLLA